MKKTTITIMLLSIACTAQAMKKVEKSSSKLTLAHATHIVTSAIKRAKEFCAKKQPENKKISFWVELPQDKYWNTGHGKVIIEAENLEPKNKDGFLKIIAPKNFKKDYPSVFKLAFIECKKEKRARKLSYAEYLDLIHKLCPNRKPPKDLKFLSNSKNWGNDYLERQKKKL